MVDGIVTFDDSNGPRKLVDDVEICSTINEFGWTEIDATLAVEEHWLLRHLVNEEPTDAKIEVSVTDTMIGATLSSRRNRWITTIRIWSWCHLCL